MSLKEPVIVVFVNLLSLYFCYVVIIAMDMPAELTALNITPQGALLRWNPPLSSVDNYVLTLTHNQGELSKQSSGGFTLIHCFLDIAYQMTRKD